MAYATAVRAVSSVENAFSAESKSWPSPDHGKKKSRFGSLFGWCFSTRFSLVLFVIAVTEGILWAYPVYCNSTSFFTGPPQYFEKANLQDYFLNNLASLKNSDWRGVHAAEDTEHQSLHPDYESEFRESLKLHALQMQDSNPRTQELRIACLLEVVLLMLISTLQSSEPSSTSGEEPGPKRKKGFDIRKGTALLLLVLLLPSATLATPIDNVQPTLTDPEATCDLQCWLANLRINIPDQQFKTSFLGIDLSGQLTGLQCSQITLTGISATVLPPTGLAIATSGLGINCEGSWAYTFGLIKDHGGFFANATDSSLDLSVVISKTADGMLANATTVTQCNPNIIISNIHFGGVTGGILDALKQVVIPLLDISLNQVICTELTSLIDVNLTLALQTIDEIIRPYLRPVPPSPPPAVPEGSMNFKTPPNPLIELLDYVLDDVIGTLGPLNVNYIANLLTGNTGSLTISKPCADGGLFSYPLTVPDLGTVVVGLCSIGANGLNTWNDFDVFRPIEHTNHSLATNTGLEELDLNITFFVNVTVANGPLTGKALYEEGLISTKLKNNMLQAATVLALNGEFFHDLALPNDILAPEGVCIAKHLWDVNITHLVFNVTVEHVLITALGGSTEKELDDALSTVLGLLISTFNPAIPALINGVVAGPLRKEINVLAADGLDALHAMADNGTVSCGIPPDIPGVFGEQGTLVAFGVTLAIFIILTVYLLVVFFIAERGKRMGMHDPAQQSLLNEQPVYAKDSSVEEKWTTRFATMMSTCLALDQRLHWTIRYGIPFFILLNIGLFVSSNASTGASVIVVLVLGEQKKELPPVFAFSLESSVRDMWEAKVYALSILIALLSGGWPYLKLVLMLVCWVLPTKWLSVRGREYFLMALDALGKWSLIDAFVMVLMMTTFSLTIKDPSQNGVVNVYVEPNYGFHTFMFATMFSLALTHIILAFHRRVKRLSMEDEAGPSLVLPADSESSMEIDSDSVPVGGINDDIEFPEAPSGSKRKPLFLRSFSNKWNKPLGIFIAVMLTISCGLLIAGSIIESFRFEIQGLAGVVVDFLGGESVRSYSVIDVGVDLPKAVEDPNSFGVRWIQAAYFVLVMGVPIGTVVILFALWVIPMDINVQRSVCHATEVLNAWSALEVYLLAVVAALLEIEQFAQFIIGDKCDQLNVILQKYFPSMSNPVCFDIQTVLITSFWYLLGAALIYMATSFVVLWRCHKGLEKHEDREHRRRSGGR